MADGRPKLFAVVALVICFIGSSNGAQQYLGKFLGKLSELHHGVSGEVYAVDARTLHLKDFTYDGEGPAAYFWAGSTRTPGSAGFRVRDENGNPAVLKRYRRKSITITLPDGKTLNNIKWFSVWCEEFAVNFGDVKIPRNFDYPKPQKINGLQGVHGVSSDNIVIVDAQTLLIPNFSYDGEAPDAKFWVGRGTKPGPQGYRVPDENGKEVPLRRYDRKTVVLTLPGDLTVFDIGHFGVWCEAFTVDFGHVRIPQQLNVPPSLKMLGVSPQSKLNCEVLYDDLAFEVRWAVAGESIVLQLVAKLDNNEYMSFGLSGDNSKTEMIGGDVVVAWVDKETLKGYAQDYFLEDKSQCAGPRGSCPDERLAENTNNIRLLNAAMVNGYSIVTYQRPLKSSDELDKQILTNQSQSIIWAIGPLNQRNEVSFHSHYTKKNHFIDFGRPAKWNCPIPESDSSSSSSHQSNIPATIQTPPPPPQRRRPENEEPTEVTTRSRVNERRRGGNREVSDRRRDQPSRQNDDRGSSRRRSSSNRERGAVTITTTERALRTVPTPKPVTNRNAWHIPPIECYEPDDRVYYAQMGPTGGKRGYPAITGHVGWGISWYINGLLIPEINVVRGQMYTFVVEGGLDPDIPAKYHPFYITDDPVGGYEHKTPEERQNIRIFAGARRSSDNKVHPTGTGRLCNWIHTGDKEADDFESFGAFQRTLELRCDAGEPGVITWTPDANTPDTVYYQCFTHRYLGWKINVLDACDETKPEGSDPEPALVLPPADADVDAFSDNNGDLISSSSINVETRINPNDLFQTKHTDRPKQSERPADTDTNYLQPHHESSGDIITQQQQSDQQPDRTHNTDIHIKNHFQSSPEIYFNPPPFKIIASESIEPITVYPSFKAENLTTTPAPTTTAISTSTRNAVTKSSSIDISTSSAVTRATLPPSKHNPIPGSFLANRHPVKPVFNTNKMPQRRPVMHSNRPPFVIKPMMLTMHRPPPMQSPYKKSFYRIPLRKRPTMRPLNPQNLQKSPFPKPVATNQEPIVIMKYHQLPLKVNLQHHKQKTTIIIPTTTQSPTTLKEIDTKGESAFASELISVKKESPTLEQISTMRPAINTGFHPESVVIEGGFKPIITKEFQDRISEDEDLENAEQQENIGVILLNPENTENSQQFIESFEPMFIPSPPDSHLLLNKKQNATKYSKRNPIIKKNPSVMVIVKHVARSAEMNEEEDDDDKLAMAAERVEAYYLPPDDRKTKPVDKIRKPSNIDIPPGAVVTFDGKTVSGVSLTAPINEPGTGTYEARSSKAAELLRLSPQFGPFRGEIPPLDPQSINAASLPQLSSQAVINRDLNAPAPGPSASQQTTRLSPVRPYRQRIRRNAHHTPEHTAEQEKHNHHDHSHDEHMHHNETAAVSKGNTHLSSISLIFVISISFLIKCINF